MLIDDIRAKLEEENQTHDCTDSQREANKFRLKLYELLSRGKAPYEPSKTLDVIMDRLTDGTTYTPQSLMRGD